jgi:hypothetical protein
MVERAEHEPTMDEIVVALRETRRGAGRGPPLTIVGGQPGANRASGTAFDPVFRDSSDGRSATPTDGRSD